MYLQHLPLHLQPPTSHKQEPLALPKLQCSALACGELGVSVPALMGWVNHSPALETVAGVAATASLLFSFLCASFTILVSDLRLCLYSLLFSRVPQNPLSPSSCNGFAFTEHLLSSVASFTLCPGSFQSKTGLGLLETFLGKEAPSCPAHHLLCSSASERSCHVSYSFSCA